MCDANHVTSPSFFVGSEIFCGTVTLFLRQKLFFQSLTPTFVCSHPLFKYEDKPWTINDHCMFHLIIRNLILGFSHPLPNVDVALNSGEILFRKISWRYEECTNCARVEQWCWNVYQQSHCRGHDNEREHRESHLRGGVTWHSNDRDAIVALDVLNHSYKHPPL